MKVVDNGCGMDEAVLPRIFEPFYTTKEKGKGTGLGLATVYGIVKQSDGYIRVQSAPGVGTSITVYLPETLMEECEAREESRRPVSVELTGKETILLVEDEEMVRELAVESLQRYGYTIMDAPNGDRALSICEGYNGTIDLLITDVVMPGMNGIELARRFRDSHPGVPVLFMSGYAEGAVEHLGGIADRQSFLQKPITPTTLSGRCGRCSRNRSRPDDPAGTATSSDGRSLLKLQVLLSGGPDHHRDARPDLQFPFQVPEQYVVHTFFPRNGELRQPADALQANDGELLSVDSSTR